MVELFVIVIINIYILVLNIIEEELFYCVQDLCNIFLEYEKKMNKDQFKVYNIVIEVVFLFIFKVTFFFLDGLGGIGKIFVYNIILVKIRFIGNIVLVVVLLGIVVELLEGGRIVYLRFKILILIFEISICNILIQSFLVELIRNVLIIIWDEVLMMYRYVFECVYRIFFDIMKNENLFGGKIVLFGGDFR